MEPFNPYQPPASEEPAADDISAKPAEARWQIAAVFMAAAVVACMAYTFVDEVVLGTAIGAWPMLFGASALSIVASIWSRGSLLAPTACFFGTIAGDVLAGIVRDWHYAQLHLCVPLAVAFSLPAVGIVAFFRRRHSLAWKREGG